MVMLLPFYYPLFIALLVYYFQFNAKAAEARFVFNRLAFYLLIKKNFGHGRN